MYIIIGLIFTLVYMKLNEEDLLYGERLDTIFIIISALLIGAVWPMSLIVLLLHKLGWL